jgi:hypothetical protein
MIRLSPLCLAGDMEKQTDFLYIVATKTAGTKDSKSAPGLHCVTGQRKGNPGSFCRCTLPDMYMCRGRDREHNTYGTLTLKMHLPWYVMCRGHCITFTACCTPPDSYEASHHHHDEIIQQRDVPDEVAPTVNAVK